MSNRAKSEVPPAGLVGLNVLLPREVHRAARLACVARGISWSVAAAEAFAAWAKVNAPKQ